MNESVQRRRGDPCRTSPRSPALPAWLARNLLVSAAVAAGHGAGFPKGVTTTSGGNDTMEDGHHHPGGRRGPDPHVGQDGRRDQQCRTDVRRGDSDGTDVFDGVMDFVRVTIGQGGAWALPHLDSNQEPAGLMPRSAPGRRGDPRPLTHEADGRHLLACVGGPGS